jgi:hypothetical protein
MKNWKKYLSILGILAVMAGVAWAPFAFADTVTVSTVDPPAKDSLVGGLPIYMTFTGTWPATFTGAATANITTVPGFIPDFVYIETDMDTSGNYIDCKWGTGMATASAHADGTTGTRSYTATQGITVSSGKISVTSASSAAGACQKASAAFRGWAARYLH